MKGIWLISAGILAGCNSFAALETVAESGPNSAPHDMGSADLGATDLSASDLSSSDLGGTDLGPDLGPVKTYTPIPSRWLYTRVVSCAGPMVISNIIQVPGADQLSTSPATSVSVALNANGSGFVRWIEGREIHGATVSMDTVGVSYLDGIAPWQGFSEDTYDTLIVRMAEKEPPSIDEFFVATLAQCVSGKQKYGEFGTSIEVTKTIVNAENTCLNLSPHVVVGIAGGFNPFDPTYQFANLYVTSFDNQELKSWNTDDFSTNATVPLESNLFPDFENPFVESTTGALIGFGSANGDSFSFWDTVDGDRIIKSRFAGVRGKIALLHLVSEHYVLAVLDGNTLTLHRFEYQEEPGAESEIVWLDEEYSTVIAETDLENDPILYVELAAFRGGFAVFYGKKTHWDIQPILMIEGEIEAKLPERMIVNESSKVVHPQSADRVAYSDLDFTITAGECALVFSTMSGYSASGSTFTNFEGASITGFYTQSPRSDR